jgi:hypothetical protein
MFFINKDTNTTTTTTTTTNTNTDNNINNNNININDYRIHLGIDFTNNVVDITQSNRQALLYSGMYLCVY